MNELLRAEIVNCPDFVIERHAIRVLRDFCMRSHVWSEEITLTIPAGDDEGALVVTAGEPFAVRSVEGVTGWRYIPKDTLALTDAVTEDTELEIEVSICPILTDTTVPEWLLDKYEDTIVYGVYARMMMQDNQAWTNPGMAMAYRAKYDIGVGGAKLDKVKQHRAVGLRAATPY